MILCDTGPLVAAELLGLRVVFTLDSHFYAYRLGNGSAFVVYP